MTDFERQPEDFESPEQIDNMEAPAAGPISAGNLAWYRFDGVKIAQGYNLNGVGRGAMVMSNIFLSTSLIYLASEEAGCLDEEDEVIDDCGEKIYGFKPATLVPNIAVIAGVLSAIFMPFIGAMVDYTDHRKAVGVIATSIMIVIQLVQIGTVSSTWFPMAILQAVSGFLYQANILAVWAYLPDIAHLVGEDSMTRYTADFDTMQFTCQLSFLIVIVGIAYASGMDDVNTAQASQAINSVWSGLVWYFAWKLMDAVPAKHQLPPDHSLFTEGFAQVVRTTKEINQTYKKGLRWFLLAVVFAEAAANAFTTVAVVFLDDHLKLSSEEIGVFFIIVILSVIPGTRMAPMVTARCDPRRSWQLSMAALGLWTAGGAVALDYVPSWMSYIWGVGVGICLGWFYPTENLWFSMCLPKGQEAELSGFYVYCSQVLVWLPPLIFSVLVSADVSQTYGIVAVTFFFPVAILILEFAAPWEEILKESGRSPDLAEEAS